MDQPGSDSARTPGGKGPNVPGGNRSITGTLRAATRELSDAGVEFSRLDAELLLMAALGWTREQIYRGLSCVLEEGQRAVFDGFVARRCNGEPSAYIAARREFWSLDFHVSRDVLIPRPETEHLVETGLEFFESWRGPRRVLELGTGSGAVGISLAHEMSDVEVWATDISAAAIEVARGNARRHGVSNRVHFLVGDLFEALDSDSGDFAAILSNPPYIASGDIPDLPCGVRDWEPWSALDGGGDGLIFHRRIIRDGKDHLLPGGLLALEIADLTASAVCERFRAGREFSPPRVIRDYAGRERVAWALADERRKSIG